jgi:FkbM family methyltransferase
MSAFHRAFFRALCRVGKPFGGVRPRRVYHWLAHRGFRPPAGPDDGFAWARDRWGLAFRLHPYFHLDRQILAFGSYEPDLIRFLRERVAPGSVCLDVGANLGQVTVHMADRVGPHGIVHAFEPVAHVAARLREHVLRNGFGDRVRIHDVALSDRTGVERLWGGTEGAENQGMASLVSDAAAGPRVEVRTERLDDFVERVGLDRIDWIKVDIQGAEPLFLAGASRTLERFAPDLTLEISPTDLAPAGSDGPSLVASLERIGYHAFELAPGGARPLRGTALDRDWAADNVWFTRKSTVSAIAR